ncbi:MAG: hypothetical protein UY92_C0003G0011 [Candidatus Magasanikbacteria bacterium GW2011_GWA2_56_11]|uniref:Probable transcriptional regulatory protein UY92_C0003G0011 n=1 Tax=Candidatus Magasanikbacteria bacterium GW2011_GWA2_56_11 TaxID=1619044 RepID=A0A0G1YHX3_9BACT|nr:MAG: hypothetical protein UY92_C0003G0011 [Candidatus Magasanikbacteria bacterium GW2011_GWA2_56_11]
MARHSKWHNIQVRKGKQDKLKGSAFTKLARLITIAAKEGGGNPEMNFSLRLAIEKAKAANLPKDNIDRAIKRGTGELGDEAALEELLYEGFGPGGIAFLVEVVTDNRNRSAGEVKNIFTKHGGSVAGPGSVQWQFERRAVVRVGESQRPKIKDREPEFELAVIDAGAEDIVVSELGWEIICAVDKFQPVLHTVERFGIEPEESGLEWLPKDRVSADEAGSEQAAGLYGALEDHDDVRAVYTNEV